MTSGASGRVVAKIVLIAQIVIEVQGMKSMCIVLECLSMEELQKKFLVFEGGESLKKFILTAVRASELGKF